jgi:phenylacetate-CoA ligase
MLEGMNGYPLREQTRQLQMEQLQLTLNRAYFNVDFYRRRMDVLQLLPEDIATLDDLRHFPFTTRRDLAEHYPYGLFAEPLKSIVRLKISNPAWLDRHRPIVVGFTRHDVAMWQSLVVRLYRQLGITERDIVQVAFNFSLFPGAFTFNNAVEILGATLAPSATISATLQLQIMQDFRSTVLATTAAFALHMADTMERQSLDASSLHLRLILLGPDPLFQLTRSHLESAFGVPVFGLYGVNEMVEPGVAGECTAQDGLHLAEDQFFAEIIHPATGEPVAPGHEGELVLTTLTAEAYPLIRYRSGDITALKEMPCSCGRTSARLAPILRRSDNRISIRGVPLYPE